MTETTEQRAYLLIEDVRADIDFELDDVISSIVRDLPEEYFQRLKRADQITHLKALLAISICQLDEEIVMRSDDHRHVAVVGRRDFPGLLSSILEKLPKDRPLIDAKIFTSKANDFIIDLFEFDTPEGFDEADSFDSFASENSIQAVVRSTGQPRQAVVEFVEHYPKTSRVLALPDELATHFQTYLQVNQSGGVAVNTKSLEENQRVHLTVAASSLRAREVVEQSARYLGQQNINIHQAFLNDLNLDAGAKVAICSFQVSGKSNKDVLERSAEIGEFLRTF